MAIASYNDLLAAVANWLNRGDLTQRIPEFVDLGSRRIRREQEWDRRLYSAETGNPIQFTAQGMPLPNGVKVVKDLWPTSGPSLKPLEQTSFAELRTRADTNLDSASTPRLYAILPPRDPLSDPARLYLWPQPSSTFFFDILYVNDVGNLDSGGNKLFTFAPDVYLWAALAESAPFLKHDERAAVWEAKYQDAIRSVNLQSEAAQFGASTRRAKIRAFA